MQEKLSQYAVFGHPISHSKSPLIHQFFARQTGHSLEYVTHDVISENFVTASDTFFANGGDGLNCTVPLKELAWQYADSLTERARLAKSVNTLAKQLDHGILGDNTDGIGLVNDLTINHNINLKDVRILMLGAGGASRGILGQLLAAHPQEVIIANRTLAKADKIVEDFIGLGSVDSCEYFQLKGREFDLIVNATSASLSGELPPLPHGILAKGGNCYDLAYSNQATAFVKWGLLNHAVHSLDGLGMLVEQAAEAFLVWRGIRPETQPVIKWLNQQREMSPAACLY